MRSRQSKKKLSRIDTDPQGSRHKGFTGFYESLFRRFKTTMYLVTIAPLYLLGGLFTGTALAPGIYFYRLLNDLSASQHPILKFFAQGIGVGVGFFLSGFCLILIVPAANFLMRTSPKTFRGPYYSVDFLRWFVHNSLTYLVRYTFLEFITPTPFNIMFFRLMGMRIGHGTHINTSNVSDPALIHLGKKVTIGGSVTLCAHYGQGGYLILAPIRIHDNVTIGLKASVMGGVEIGEGAKVLPHSVVLPKTVIPPGETWGGVPAEKIILKKKSAA